ncbi:hypothetical protein FM117_06105 [Micrococcus luteus Mu201]|nr:hypothetical protein FM117_06105 [Micrococcus luteus Mu201]
MPRGCSPLGEAARPPSGRGRDVARGRRFLGVPGRRGHLRRALR